MFFRVPKENILNIVSEKSEFTFSRSGGPGGQNVNKLNTKAVIKFNISHLKTIFDHKEISMVKEKLANRINAGNEIVVHVQEERTQIRNREIAVYRMTELIYNSIGRNKKRKKTRPSKGSVEKRLKLKKILKSKKQNRRNTNWD